MNLRFLLSSALFCALLPAAEIRVATPTAGAEAMAKAKPGDVVVLADGLYRDAKLSFRAEGNAEKPILFRAATPGQVRFTGKSQLTFGGNYVRVEGLVFDQAWGSFIVVLAGAKHCVLSDCAFIECGSPTSSYPPIVWLSKGTQHSLVTRCYMRGNLSMGMAVAIKKNDCRNTHNTFSWNHYKDIKRRASNGQEAVQIGQGGFSDRSSQYATVEHCLFERASGDSEIISNKSSDNTYRYNTFRQCGAMLVLRGGQRARVEGNFMLGNSGGIRVHGSGHVIVNNHIQDCSRDGIYLPNGARHYGPVNFCVIAHNTIVNCGTNGIYIGRPNPHPSTTWELIPTFNDFIGNVVVGNRGTLIRDDGSHTTTWRNNIVWATDKAVPGLEVEGIARRDPGLQVKNGLWRPANASPLGNPPSPNFRDVNGSIPGLNQDAYGQKRDQKPDLGCEEIGGTKPTRGPLTPEQVGPRWMEGDEANVSRIPNPQPVPKIRRISFKQRSKTLPTIAPVKNADGNYVLNPGQLVLVAGAIPRKLPAKQTGITFPTVDAQAECSIRLPPGRYIAKPFAYAENTDTDAFHLWINGTSLRTYPKVKKTVSPCATSLPFVVKDGKPLLVILLPGEAGSTVARIEITPVRKQTP